MNKSELIETIAQRTGQSSGQVDDAVRTMFEVMCEQVAKGDKVSVTGYLTVEQTDRKARKGRNPQTGDPIDIPASKAAKVTAGAKLKAAAKGA